jgi:hypothetical protein
MKQVLLIVLLTNFSTIGYAQNKSTHKLQQLNWLQGEWVMNSKDAHFIEYWSVVNDLLWQGAGYGISIQGDTLFKESLQIAVQNDTVWYLPTIANQNGGKQIRFAAVELSAHKAAFENKQHDFPQRIVYNKTSDSTIYAYVEGMKKGKMRKEEFHFKRK